MMRQYRNLKMRYPDHLLLFRLGDFYETFFEDAELAARLLQITLTARQGAPMAGIPHHAADGYLARLVHAGQKIAVCEQLEAPGPTKKLLRRGVVRIITPGTLTDTAYLEGAANNFLLAVVRGRGVTGVAFVDVSTGEFWAGEDVGKRTEVLASARLRRPAEIVLPDSVRTDTAFLARLQATGAALTFCEPSTFSSGRAAADLCAHFGVESLAPFGVGGGAAGLGAAAAALAYPRTTQGNALGHLTRLMRLTPADAMVLDETAVVTLELLESSRGSVRDSLFAVLDETVTPMGARLLRQWLLRPLLDPGAIAARQAAVGALVEAPAERASLSALLRQIGDLERLTSRATLGQAHGRDLVGLRTCLAPLPEIQRVAAAISAEPIEEALAELAPLGDLRDFLAAALEDEPPLGLHDGGLIRESWHEGLAAIVRDAREARAWIAGLEERERVRTGIPSLRVRFNRALGADERCRRLEYELFEDVRRRVAARAEELLVTARAIGRLDVFASLAAVAHARGHVRPIVDRGDALTLIEGRHPVLEARAGSPVTPNDLALDRDARIVILTGPNMSGKSVYLRQTAHIAIMAQIGAFVPAREARIGVVDRVFTRVGAQDNLAHGQSTFLVEMIETATILNNITPRSLVLLDEVGRGTSTFDGLAIAWAVVEAPPDRRHGAKGLFAPHFHELTRLAARLGGVRSFHVAVREWNDEIVFLHKVQPGGTDQIG